jgi:hypothetical protein
LINLSGSEHFDPERFIKIENRPLFTKPIGGLWASPIDAPRSWENWCKKEHFHLDRLEKNFKFRLKPDAKVLYINYAERLDSLPKVKPQMGLEHFDSWDCLDFEKLAKKYDAVELSLSNETTQSTHPWKGLYHRLYGWDCDSILIMNKDCIELEED